MKSLLEDMLDVVEGESERIDSRFLEPACGSGNTLTQRSSIEGTLFAELEEHDVFIPPKTYPPMTVTQIAQWAGRRS